MTREQTPLRISFLLYLGLAIGVLLIIVGTDFWHRNLREGSSLLALAVTLIVIFFRRRLFALSLAVLSVLIALLGMGAISHRSISAAIGSLAALGLVYLLARWDFKKNGARSLGGWQSLFENDGKPR
jgi:hypothetical protein